MAEWQLYRKRLCTRYPPTLGGVLDSFSNGEGETGPASSLEEGPKALEAPAPSPPGKISKRYR